MLISCHQTTTFTRDTLTVSQPQSYNEFLQKIQPAHHGVSLLRFAAVFFVAFFLLQWAYQALNGTAIYRFYIEMLTVRPSAEFIGLIAPADGIIAQAHRLVWQGGRLSVLNGCDGAEAMALLIAAFIAVAGPFRMRLGGIALGVLLIYGLNQGRIVALYFAARHDKPLFELIHGLAGPLTIIALACLFFAWWIGRDGPETPA